MQRSVPLMSEQGLTVDEYNEIIATADSDPELEQRVLIACKALS